jgi:hypothetical protein
MACLKAYDIANKVEKINENRIRINGGPTDRMMRDIYKYVCMSMINA